MTGTSTEPLLAARRADSNRRRQKVLDALAQLTAAGEEISVSAVARAAGVDRSFLYRHHDLRSRILAQATQPDPPPASPRVSHRSLLADLANARAHNERLRRQNTKLTERLSETLGTEAFHAAGLTTDEEVQTLRARVADLERQLHDARRDLNDKDDELTAARTANRDLIATLNTTRQPNP
jgi:chromosome segregation ATPase